VTEISADPQASRGFGGGGRGGFKRNPLDAPRHCPHCGASLTAGAGITVEFWQGTDRIFHTWCGGCHWTGDITPITDMIGHEPDH
jgi:hypothetical protein